MRQLLSRVTTVIAGPDGFGTTEVGTYLAKVAAAKPAINLAAFIGHGAVRKAVIGMTNRLATPEELDRMRQLVRTGMREGAVGMSTGLFLCAGQLRTNRGSDRAGSRGR